MSQRRGDGRAYRRAGALACAAILSPGFTAGCSSTGASTAGGSAAPALPTPMATSLTTVQGTWAVLAMGRSAQPANTFWQLLFRPTGHPKWSDQVEATATATNGGLVLASAAGKSLVVAVRPSADLTFTPIISTNDVADGWSNGLIDQGLQARPSALAAHSGGRALALVGDHSAARVLSATGHNLSRWHELTSEQALGATGAGRSCRLGQLSAVGYLSGRPIIGASCAAPGVVGLFIDVPGTWELSGPSLGRSLKRSRSEVIYLGGTGSGVRALVEVVDADKTDIVAAWGARSGRWATSPPLPLGAGEQVWSSGPDGNGLFVLLGSRQNNEKLFTVKGAGASWATLAAPPPGTSTVAFSAAATAEAMAVSGRELTVWSLGQGSTKWATVQVLHVALQYGSSS